MSVYLIIFGAAVRPDGSPSGSLTRRVDGAIAFARTISRPMFIATGGVGRYGPAEAVVIRDLLLQSGVRADDILLEIHARDTLESIEFCGAILAGCDDVEFVVPCTSRYHIPRCALLIRLLGYRVKIPIMPPDRRYIGVMKWVTYVLKELIALPYDACLLLMRRAVRVMRPS